MNVEELSKSQLLLLMLLVNFVTSIATGILTVSLLDHAPPVVAQTVNRIVETVAPAPVAAVIKATPAPVIVTTPSTEDLTVAAIAAEASRTVYIYADGSAGTTSPALATGTYLSKSRAVATLFADALPKQALIQFPDGSTAEVSLSHATSTVMIYGFADKAVLPAASVPSLVSAKSLKLGQSVLAITADGSAVSGIVSKIEGDTVTTTLPKIPEGSAAVDLSGDIVGISNGDGTYTIADLVSSALTATSTPSKPV